MSNYRRNYSKGGCYFFTLVTYQRTHYFCNEENLNILRAAFHHIKQQRPFRLDAIVILPEHLHCIMDLPDGDVDYSSRWREIKKYVSKRIECDKNQRGENLLWQRRFWEHTIKDKTDWKNHMDYIHYNPVKHGYVTNPKEWHASSLSKCIEKGWYDNNWAVETIPENIKDINLE